MLPAAMAGLEKRNLVGESEAESRKGGRRMLFLSVLMFLVLFLVVVCLFVSNT